MYAAYRINNTVDLIQNARESCVNYVSNLKKMSSTDLGDTVVHSYFTQHHSIQFNSIQFNSSEKANKQSTVASN
jgi:hypothetical protein